MADTDYVEPLTGEEIVIDLCSQIASKLRTDCNLRESDSYANGYMAQVTIHLEAYSMDTATVDVAVATGKPKTQTLGPEDLVVNTVLEVPKEEALDQVRERSDQPVPTLATVGGTPEVRQRRYVRQSRVQGGATGEL